MDSTSNNYYSDCSNSPTYLEMYEVFASLCGNYESSPCINNREYGAKFTHKTTNDTIKVKIKIFKSSTYCEYPSMVIHHIVEKNNIFDHIIRIDHSGEWSGDNIGYYVNKHSAREKVLQLIKEQETAILNNECHSKNMEIILGYSF
jgi:hypothetical protein